MSKSRRDQRSHRRKVARTAKGKQEHALREQRRGKSRRVRKHPTEGA